MSHRRRLSNVGYGPQLSYLTRLYCRKHGPTAVLLVTILWSSATYDRPFNVHRDFTFSFTVGIGG